MAKHGLFLFQEIVSINEMLKLSAEQILVLVLNSNIFNNNQECVPQA